MQAKTAKDKVRLDNFERRYAVFEAFRIFVKDLLRHAKIDEQKFHEFSISTADVDFLFGKEVSNYVEEFRARAIKMLVAQGNLSGEPTGEYRQKLTQTKHEEVAWFADQHDNLKKLYHPYLHLPQP